MRGFLVFLALFAGQMGALNTLQDKPVVRLPPHQNFIPIEYGGFHVELKSALPTIQLPPLPPKLDSHGIPWSIEVKNLGPDTVTVVGNALFSVQIPAGQTVRIRTTSNGYSRLE